MKVNQHFKGMVWLPYQLGMWFNQYINPLCCVCHSVPSQPSTMLHNRAKLLHTGQHTFNKGVVCSHCHNDITWLPPPFTTTYNDTQILSIQPAAAYNSTIRQAIIAFKYKENLTALPLLVHAIQQLDPPTGLNQSNSVILPVPTTNQRLIKRGFDPVTVLAKHLSYYWQIPLFYGVMRIDKAMSQQGLTRQQRLDNIQDAFRVTEPLPVKNIILFDDVATTGATLKALAECVNNVNHHTIVSAYAIAHGVI